MMVLPLTFCSTAGDATGGCSWVEPIWVHADDALTDGTARQILSHNMKWEDICA